MAQAKGKQSKAVSAKTTRKSATAAAAGGKVRAAAKAIEAPTVAEAEDETGFESFCQAVANQLHEKGPQIARKLGQKSAAGDLHCTKLMIDLADPAKKRKRKPSGPESSVAIKIASEPEWEAEKSGKRAARP
jgi:hypothetical protein